MHPELDQLLRDVATAIGAPTPTWLDDDAPVLADAQPQAPFYLIGLIGGKDVGKSALVNALVGHDITARTSFGPGTESVIAYAHESQSGPLHELLDREVPGKFTIIPHTVETLQRQVLLDLPDVDSHWADHVAVTRRMLRHMLFPVWVQSVEKYADRQPQELLAKVAAGNAPANFVFCLNKVDQLEGSGFRVQGSEANPSLNPEPRTPNPILDVQHDYALRLARVLSLDAPPKSLAHRRHLPRPL